MPTTSADHGGAARRLPVTWDRETTNLAAVLITLAVVAFLVRLVPVLLRGGLSGIMGFDDTVYFGAAIAFVEGRLPYRDFNILHPPGIVYLLSPFAALGGFVGDATAFGIARVGFMVLGAINTILVGIVALRAGRTAAVFAAATYALWVVPVQWDRTTYLIAPQCTLLLVALYLLTRHEPQTLTLRRVALAGAVIGVAGIIQIWAAVPAAIVFGWLLLAFRAEPRRMIRIAAAYVAGGVAAALLLLLPFLIAAGPRMIQLIIFTQIGRNGSGFGTGRAERLRSVIGLPPHSHLSNQVPDALVVLTVLAIVAIIGLVAWKRREIRLWVAVLAGQTVFLMFAPVYFPHYAGWLAPQAALAAGAVAATTIDWLGPESTGAWDRCVRRRLRRPRGHQPSPGWGARAPDTFGSRPQRGSLRHVRRTDPADRHRGTPARPGQRMPAAAEPELGQPHPQRGPGGRQAVALKASRVSARDAGLLHLGRRRDHRSPRKGGLERGDVGGPAGSLPDRAATRTDHDPARDPALRDLVRLCPASAPGLPCA